MKFKITTILLSIAIMFSLTINNASAKKVTYHQSITVNPIGLAFGMINATYEQQLSKTNSFTVSGLYWDLGSSLGNWTAYGIGGSYRWYNDLFHTRKKPLEGLSFGPKIAISTWTYNVSEYWESELDGGLTVAVGGEATYKWVWSNFALETGVDILFNVISPSDLSGSGYSAFGLVGAVGYAW